MADDRRGSQQLVMALLEASNIPVPDDEIEALSEMYSRADQARRQLRLIRLGETEPVVVFAAEEESANEQ
jgi:hypothetical protein